VDAYTRIAGVIRYLDECHCDQPDLSDLARRARLSPCHFHRLFTSWAGVTPKDFLQCLTVSGAKQLLREGKSVLDAALDSGLSGPGRLHDLCLNLEAASPGELKSGGAGWKLSAGFASTPFGKCLIAQSPRGVCHLAFVDSSTAEAWAELQAQWPHAGIHRDDGAAARLARRIFSRSVSVHRPRRSALRAWVAGTAFQVRVWRALLHVPPGKLVSYGQLARAAGVPGAARAVGNAVGSNPIAYLIPCHRVIRETGVVGHYRWGSTRKRALLSWEMAGRAPAS
jgi:AraC family transcriptional regulator of adaptative response/methylated-DNA-[protein]-cysteine methyltransferase